MTSRFEPYGGAAISSADNGIRMPKPLINASTYNGTISAILLRFREFTEAERDLYPWATRFVMGYPLPDWQRDLVWSQEQKIRLIESVWKGVGIGSFILNDIAEYDDNGCFKKFSDLVLDGQQRLAAIEGYVTNEFPVLDFEGKPRYWEELPRVERRRFSNSTFPHLVIKSWDETFLKTVYDLHAFGGTPHKPNERALPKCG